MRVTVVCVCLHAYTCMCFFHLYSTLFYKGLEAPYKEFEPAKTIVLNFRENALKKTDKFLPFNQDSPVTFFC